MHKPQSSSIFEFALAIVESFGPLVALIQRRDRVLASQVRRATSSIALNLAEGFGAAGGNARLRFEFARGSLNEVQAGLRIAVAWGYVDQAQVAEVLAPMDRLGARIYGLMRR